RTGSAIGLRAAWRRRAGLAGVPRTRGGGGATEKFTRTWISSCIRRVIRLGSCAPRDLMTELAESRSPSDPPVAAHPSSGSPDVAQLTAALAGRDSFIGVLGHELRNSVSPMLLLADQLRAMADEPAAPPALAARVT